MRPSLEFVVPSGNVYEHLVQYFNHIKMSFELNYNFFQNSISGDVAFSYPYRRITPETRFFVNLDFENYFYPEFEEGQLKILPTDIFKGNLTEERVLDEGTDLTLRTGAIYHTLEAKKPEHMLTFEGVYFSSFFDWIFRNSFNDPTSLSNANRLILKFGLHERWLFEEAVSLNYPIKTWVRDISGFYALGGFDTIRPTQFFYEHRNRALICALWKIGRSF